jgi:hypothetical protein
MDSDRFDDVKFEILEAPEPAPKRRQHKGVVAVAAVFAAGALAAGAGAHTNGTTSAAATAKPKTFKHHGGCHHGLRDSSVRY